MLDGTRSSAFSARSIAVGDNRHGNVRHRAADAVKTHVYRGADSSCAAHTATTPSRLCEVTNGGSTSREFEHWKSPSSGEYHRTPETDPDQHELAAS
jgi:hypothetical protein